MGMDINKLFYNNFMNSSKPEPRKIPWQKEPPEKVFTDFYYADGKDEVTIGRKSYERHFLQNGDDKFSVSQSSNIEGYGGYGNDYLTIDNFPRTNDQDFIPSQFINLFGEDGNDVLQMTGRTHNSSLNGGIGDDKIYYAIQYQDPDKLDSNNIFDGGEGNDWIWVQGQLNATLLGGEGNDDIDITAGGFVNYKTQMQNFKIDAGTGDDSIGVQLYYDGDETSDILYGEIKGGSGNDTLSFAPSNFHVGHVNYVYDRLLTQKNGQYTLDLNNFYIIDSNTIGFKTGDQAHEVLKINRDVENIDVTAPDKSKISTTFAGLYNVLKRRIGKTPPPPQDIG